MMSARYRFVGDLAEGQRVLDVACGSGQGIGYLQRRGCKVVGGDLSPQLLQRARVHYGSTAQLVNCDAHELPFADDSFDAVVLHEAIYYLQAPDRFLEEARRVLSGAQGKIIMCSANPERRDFNPSPRSRRYFSSDELRQLLRDHGFEPEVRGGFPVQTATLRNRLIFWARRVGRGLKLFPRTMAGKVWLKRLFYGRLVHVQPEITGEPKAELTPVERGRCERFKVLYAIGRLSG